MSREWHYWTKNKLEILSGYLPAFNKAAKNLARERIYIDLMAGQASNKERYTGAELDGSPRRALKSSPGFTRHVFCEMPGRAEELRESLKSDFPTSIFEVVAGDCNATIDATLRSLTPWNWAPTFAFIDQQAAEIHWSTIVKLAKFKRASSKTKSELWILASPAMIAKGAKGTNNQDFRTRVSLLYGNDDWLRILRAREEGTISAQEYRGEMVNLLRFQLEHTLGYRYTHRIPMKMPNGGDIYDMVFATDHYVGDKIMRHLYDQAAKREPGMMAEAKSLAREEKIAEMGQEPLFETERHDPPVSGSTLWRPEPCWDPKGREWW